MQSLSPLCSHRFSQRRHQTWRYLSACGRFGFSPAPTEKKTGFSRSDAGARVVFCLFLCATLDFQHHSKAQPQRSPLKSDGYLLKRLIASASRITRQFDQRELCVSEQIGGNEADDSPRSSGLLINLWEVADAADLQGLQRYRTSAKVNSAMILNILTF